MNTPDSNRTKRQRIEFLEQKLLSLFEAYNLDEYRRGWIQVPDHLIYQLAELYLDGHYTEHPENSGIFYNPVTGAQVRMMEGDITGHYRGCPPHANFDTIWKRKGPNYHLEFTGGHT